MPQTRQLVRAAALAVGAAVLGWWAGRRHGRAPDGIPDGLDAPTLAAARRIERRLLGG